MLPATHATKKPGFSAAERRVEAAARRRANRQLLRVPWPKFRKAYEEYPRWHALSLWTHLAAAPQGADPSWLIADLRKRCPGFPMPEAPRPGPIDLRLSAWVRHHKFGYARREGWLDALAFYGARHPRSESAWNWWEQYERDGNKHKPEALPSFDVWWRDAGKTKLCEELSCREIGRMVQAYLNWEALSLWVRPFLASHAKLPAHVLHELKQVCPGILEPRHSGISRGAKENSEIWRDLMRRNRDPFPSGPGKPSVRDAVLELAKSHPLHARLRIYGMHWSREWLKHRRETFPTFRQWRRAADCYTKGWKISL